MAPQPSVSILIPAYKPRFFESCLRSALGQTYRNLEIIVSDDSEEGAIAEAVARCAPGRVRYVRNRPRLGFHGNFARLLSLATGRYVKFLNHDDVLKPACLASMVSAFEFLGSRVSLVTSRRQLIDESDNGLPDTAASKPLADSDCTFDGSLLGDALLVQGVNRIGEPSTAMFRRADVSLVGSSLFRIDERAYTCLADMALWLRLLARGSMAYLAVALSASRVHSAQLQLADEVAAGCVVERYYLPKDARKLGFLQAEAEYRAALCTGAALVRKARDTPNLSAGARAILDEAHRQIACDARGEKALNASTKPADAAY
jgi:glycosyltransferase involved in cell wall biosynthesis